MVYVEEYAKQLFMKIIALNLPRILTSDELKNLFIPFGKVDKCSIVIDAKNEKSKGFAFIEMPVKLEAEKAIKILHKIRVHKKKIRIKCADK